ncbi:hypothetical protein EXIGLDRAFT_828264 [Exidia glandulosa HHB12029]|uniref:DNA replication factor Cdt1 C-terminal domain-containing protein n=1 Tax=Exidia glandulosa HHB12029 TaxID=1314781 RepID=A0A165R209_EXIGL|nr:hypothetical protein EXIGLDRAFT_828264 [Exidia glandulosa HHB12029]
MDGLSVSPRKRRVLLDDSVTTPKRQRILTQTPTPATSSRARGPSALPAEFAHIHALQRAITSALSQALAQSALSPDYDTGRLPNVVNHVGLASSAAAVGLKYNPTQEDIKRLCWLWEWDAEALPRSAAEPRTPPKLALALPKSPLAAHDDDDENPFLDASPVIKTPSKQSKDWLRGGMGFIVTPTTHLNREERKRVPAYGIGVEVDVAGDINAGLAYGSGIGGGGMASVARWAAAGETRKALLKTKLDRWIQLNSDKSPVPLPPLADLPPLTPGATLPASENAKHERTKKFLSSPSPGGNGSLRSKPPGRETPGSPTRSSSPTKRLFGLGVATGGSSRVVSTPSRLNAKAEAQEKEFAIPFPPTPSSSEPQTPSKHADNDGGSRPVTPVHPRSGGQELTTPTSSRTPSSATEQVASTPRQRALAERIRLRSLSSTPTSKRISSAPSTPGSGSGGMLGKGKSDALRKAENRRLCLLGRLTGVAESVWMSFSGASVAAGGSGLSMSRARRAKPMNEMVRAVVKSSPVPISEAEAHESLTMLTELCPFFLTCVAIQGEEWLEMPSSSSSASGSSSLSASASTSRTPPSSPGAGRVLDEIRTRSPRHVKNEAGGLREVRERIKRELDKADAWS